MVLLGAKTSPGHAAAVPVQYSGGSQVLPGPPRQRLVKNASVGQTEEAPVQVSATSQTPAAPRQVVLFEAKTSIGQAVWPATQVSATSHRVADARHTPPASALMRPRQRPFTAPVAALAHD